jgi:S-DNA-T family DNA segregation ATPase FtsK/SpoIIIE
LAGSRKRSNKKKAGEKIRCEVTGIALIALSILVFLGMEKGQAGVFGGFFKDYVFGLFGVGGYGIPAFIMLAGIIYILKINPSGIENRALPLFLLYFSLINLIHMLSAEGQLVMLREGATLWENLKENTMVAFEYGMEKKGGGIVGSIFTLLFFKVLGPLGSKIVMAALLLISATLLTNFSFVTFFLKLLRGTIRLLKDCGTAIKEFVMVPVQPERKIEINSKVSVETQEKTREEVPKPDESIRIIDFSAHQRTASETAAAAEIEDTGFHKINMVNEYPGYRLPPVSLLEEYENKKSGNRKELLSNARKLEETLNTFGVDAKVVQVSVGPSITRYELQPSPGVKVSRILALSDDIALSMAATSVRI